MIYSQFSVLYNMSKTYDLNMHHHPYLSFISSSYEPLHNETLLLLHTLLFNSIVTYDPTNWHSFQLPFPTTYFSYHLYSSYILYSFPHPDFKYFHTICFLTLNGPNLCSRHCCSIIFYLVKPGKYKSWYSWRKIQKLINAAHLYLFNFKNNYKYIFFGCQF